MAWNYMDIPKTVMQKSKDKTEKKLPVKKEHSDVAPKTKPTKKPDFKEKIDEQDSDGSGGAFEEFIDQQRDE
jgi:hypothetical protein